MPFIQPYLVATMVTHVSPDDVTGAIMDSHLSLSNPLSTFISNHFDTYMTLSRLKIRRIKQSDAILVPSAVLVT